MNLFSKLKFKIILEEVFGIKILRINSMNLPTRRRRLGRFEGTKNSYKRFYVTLLCFFYFYFLSVVCAVYVSFLFLNGKFFLRVI